MQEDALMNINGDHDDLTRNDSKSETFNLSDLVLVIGYQQTAVDWLQHGLAAALEPRMRAAFDVAAPIAKVVSEFKAQGFLIAQREETGFYRSPARMFRDADVDTARSVLIRLAAAEFLSNEAPNLDDIEVHLQDWIEHAELPEGVGYKCTVWQNRLALTLVHVNFAVDVERNWDRGLEWPSWDQIIAAVPEMARARCEIDMTTGCPFRHLRPHFVRPASDEEPSDED